MDLQGINAKGQNDMATYRMEHGMEFMQLHKHACPEVDSFVHPKSV